MAGSYKSVVGSDKKSLEANKFEKAKELILKRHICLNLEEEVCDVIVTIPVLADISIFETLESIRNAETENLRVCVFVLVNEPECTDEKTKHTNLMIYNELQKMKNLSQRILLLVRYVQDIPRKLAGVGFARRLLMDEVVCMLERTKSISPPDPTEEKIITSLDADCTVSKDYFRALSDLKDFGIFLFSHRLSNIPEAREAGMLWEILLRYWRNSLRLYGYTFSFYTIGSLFAFRPRVYIVTGGMNMRKAGEDFYFAQKIIPYFSVSDIQAYVFPKAEPSERTPFGTGKEIQLYINGEKDRLTKVWKLEVFEEIGRIFQKPDTKNHLFEEFLKEHQKYASQIEHLRNMSKDEEDFEKKFRTWFNLFKVLKFLRFSEKVMGKNHLEIEAKRLIENLKKSGKRTSDSRKTSASSSLRLPDEEEPDEREHDKNGRLLSSCSTGKLHGLISTLDFLRRYDEENLHHSDPRRII